MRKLSFLFLALVSLAAAQTAVQPPFPEWAITEKNIAYDQYPETILDIVRPKAQSKDERPGVICIHGGGWVIGAKEDRTAVALRYVEKGFVAAVIEYRLAKAANAPAAVTDVLKAAQWFRRNAKKYGVDPNRIVVEGGSAGGHLALMVGLTPKSAKLGPQAKIAAVVNFYGITDVGDQLHGAHRRGYTETWVPEQAGRMELARRVSPMTYVRKHLPPVLTIHGDSDRSVPYEHGVNLANALRETGNEAELITVKGGGHGGFAKEKFEELYDQIWQFLQKRGVLR